MAKRKLKKGDEDLLKNASPEFLAQMEEIKKLPDDSFVYLPDEEAVTMDLSGKFHNALRTTLGYLLESEESFKVIKALYRVKHNFMDLKTKKPIPPNKITPYETAMWTILNLTEAITAASVAQKKSRVVDKAQFMKAFADVMSADKRDYNPNLQALDETELANRMGLRVDDRTGELVIDKEYLKQHDLTNPKENTIADDELKGRFGVNLGPDDIIDEELINPTNYIIPERKQKGNKGKYEEW